MYAAAQLSERCGENKLVWITCYMNKPMLWTNLFEVKFKTVLKTTMIVFKVKMANLRKIG